VTPGSFSPDEAETRAEAVVDEFGERYWRKTYGGRDAFECLVRTVLSQNTSDTASQPAHEALMERYGDEAGGAGDDDESDADADLARALADADRETLAETIRPAGLYNQKSETIVRLAERVVAEYGGEDGFDDFVREGDPDGVRDALLDMNGVGPKTADCVLLFAGGRDGVFPVDTHVHRIARRMGLAPPEADHETVRAYLEGSGDADGFPNGGTRVVDGEETRFESGGVPPEKCGFGHTAMIQFGREYCTARKPACLDGPEACPLYDLCDRVGVSPETGEVVDPAETVK
jgi:endonuclease-3